MSLKRFANSLMISLLRPSYLKRFVFFVLADAAIFSLSYLLSFSIRFSITEFFINYDTFKIFLPIFILSKIILLLLFDMYAVSWKYFSIRDAIRMFIAILSAQLLAYLTAYFLFRSSLILVLSRSVFFLDFFISFFMLLALRSFKRAIVFMMNRESESKKKIIIYGAGDGGEQIVREMLKKESPYDPVAIIDDNRHKWNMRIHGITILGGLSEVKKAMRKTGAATILIAIPSIEKERLNEIFDFLKNQNIRDIKILPSVRDSIDGKMTLQSVKNIDIADLLGRESVKLDFEEIGRYLKNQNVLITGACGSIGSEIFRQVLEYSPNMVYAIDNNETELFYLEMRTPAEKKGNVETILADVRDRDVIDDLFASRRIDVVFHAAALKHVPICEKFPEEGIKTNILGTRNLVNASKGKAKRFLFISTDKAVNPSSIMGGTKRIAEFIVTAASGGKTIFSCVRFGNVLGSRGSVIPIFEEQIRNKGPVTITHPDMKRYFMTIQEAVQLCLEAAGGAVGGEVFILDMGEPVYIKDLAEKMIRMMGYEPGRDISIVYTGKRKGEKLFEELLRAEEGAEDTRFEKIFKAVGGQKMDDEKVGSMVSTFLAAKSHAEVKVLFKSYIPRFKHEE
ncbi:MAG: nucleoside-diphosphate sugar epimerase/dehydratase [bacterium]|nr:nucleoside-diphosphate sugar epimerase/dehydratase [bacterium]